MSAERFGKQFWLIGKKQDSVQADFLSTSTAANPEQIPPGTSHRTSSHVYQTLPPVAGSWHENQQYSKLHWEEDEGKSEKETFNRWVSANITCTCMPIPQIRVPILFAANCERKKDRMGIHQLRRNMDM